MMTETLYRATHPGDPSGIGSHWTTSREDAEFWQTAGGGCGGPVIVERTVTGRFIDADDMDSLLADYIDEVGGTRLTDADWEPDWIGQWIGDLPEGIAAVETSDDQGRTAYVLA